MIDAEKEVDKNLEGNTAVNDILESFASKPVAAKKPEMASLEASVSKIANYLKNTTVWMEKYSNYYLRTNLTI